MNVSSSRRVTNSRCFKVFCLHYCEEMESLNIDKLNLSSVRSHTSGENAPKHETEIKLELNVRFCTPTFLPQKTLIYRKLTYGGHIYSLQIKFSYLILFHYFETYDNL